MKKGTLGGRAAAGRSSLLLGRLHARRFGTARRGEGTATATGPQRQTERSRAGPRRSESPGPNRWPALLPPLPVWGRWPDPVPCAAPAAPGDPAPAARPRGGNPGSPATPSRRAKSRPRSQRKAAKAAARRDAKLIVALAPCCRGSARRPGAKQSGSDSRRRRSANTLRLGVKKRADP